MSSPTTSDYSSWTNEDLIKRISQLESRLRIANEKHNPPYARLSPTPSSAKKPKKANKSFDRSRYATRLVALKFAYLGSNYNGFEHHSNNVTPRPTVEEILWKALMKTKLIFPTFRQGQSEDDVCWDGCEYSKCGRTDRGVSAFGQVIGIRLRSNRRRERRTGSADAAETTVEGADNGSTLGSGQMHDGESSCAAVAPFDDVRDELPYIQILNRVLPSDIRVLAWCPHPRPDFNARFSCRERRYRYFFTNPAFPPLPGHDGKSDDGWLDIEAMRIAANKYEGLHDFRNFCKVDASKQITNFQRRIFHADIHEATPADEPGSFIGRFSSGGGGNVVNGHRTGSTNVTTPKLYWFEVRGSAFLWHQVRHLIAVLFLVGQGVEAPSVVDELLQVSKYPAKPLYDMASDTPLVLWDCIFPAQSGGQDHVADGAEEQAGYCDALRWIYAGDEDGARDNPGRQVFKVEDGKFGRMGIMEDLWSLWRTAKINEVLAGSLMDVVAGQGKQLAPEGNTSRPHTARVVDGSGLPKSVGTYVPLLKRARMEPPEEVNARWAARKGIKSYPSQDNGDGDE